MQVLLPELESPEPFILGVGHPFSDEEYFAFCVANPDLFVERSSEGQIVIVPPAGPESDYRSATLIAQLVHHAQKGRLGRAFASSAQFILPDGSALSPDAAWISNESLAAFSSAQKKKFLHLAPDFVIEVLSPSDRLPKLQQKMERWVVNGVRLAWLIDADRETVHVYRPNQPPEVLTGPKELSADPAVPGLVVDLRPAWESL
jgi:Uma2 family endonuclease